MIFSLYGSLKKTQRTTYFKHVQMMAKQRTKTPSLIMAHMVAKGETLGPRCTVALNDRGEPGAQLLPKTSEIGRTQSMGWRTKYASEC